jgi:hypothetical protein
MNTNDLPAPVRLACLIEAGVAANPDVSQGQFNIFRYGLYAPSRACALGYAILGMGVSRDRASVLSSQDAVLLLGFPLNVDWVNDVWKKNDRGEPIAAICDWLRNMPEAYYK